MIPKYTNFSKRQKAILKKIRLELLSDKALSVDFSFYDEKHPETMYLPEQYIELSKSEYTGHEIEEQAKQFAKKWLNESDWEKTCPICGAINCKNNETCIKCNCQF